MSGRKRLQLDLSHEQHAVLKDMQIVTVQPTLNDVVRDALELYDLVLAKLSEGKHLYIGCSREEAGEVLLPHLERARRGPRI